VSKEDCQTQILKNNEEHKDSIRLLFKQKIDSEMEQLRELHSPNKLKIDMEMKLLREKHEIEIQILKETLKNISK